VGVERWELRGGISEGRSNVVLEELEDAVANEVYKEKLMSIESGYPHLVTARPNTFQISGNGVQNLLILAEVRRLRTPYLNNIAARPKF
jgi:hypothetical protein